MEITFSIIIPHKNIPSLLARCIESIPLRDDIQIIVIDDNSNDTIVNKSRMPYWDRKGIEYHFLQENRGAGYARNVGLTYAKGLWIIFADADDYFSREFNNFLDKWQACDADVVYYNANSVDTEYYINAYRAYQLNKFIALYSKIHRKGEILLRYKFGEPWCKMIKLDLIRFNNILFDDFFVHEDTWFSLMVGHFSKTIAVEKEAIYTVTLRFNSLSLSPSINRLMCMHNVFMKVCLFYRRNKIKLKEKRHIIALYLILRNFSFKELIKFIDKTYDSGKQRLQIYLCLIFNLPYFMFYEMRKIAKSLFVKYYFYNLQP